jgi:NAD(P)-dependent dehydrogenase (short-subunit alcohol dehydrogenase family)
MADVSDPKDVGRLVAEANTAFGPVDIAVSNVGRRLLKPFESISIEDWDWAIRTNLSSCFYLAHHVIPVMKERMWGRVIHVSGFDGFTGHIVNRAYNIAAKAGMHGFSKALGREPFGITANTVAVRSILTRLESASGNAELQGTQSGARVGHVDDIATVRLSLHTGSFVNGQAIPVNGGQYMF